VLNASGACLNTAQSCFAGAGMAIDQSTGNCIKCPELQSNVNGVCTPTSASCAANGQGFADGACVNCASKGMEFSTSTTQCQVTQASCVAQDGQSLNTKTGVCNHTDASCATQAAEYREDSSRPVPYCIQTANSCAANSLVYNPISKACQYTEAYCKNKQMGFSESTQSCTVTLQFCQKSGQLIQNGECVSSLSTINAQICLDNGTYLLPNNSVPQCVPASKYVCQLNGYFGVTGPAAPAGTAGGSGTSGAIAALPSCVPYYKFQANFTNIQPNNLNCSTNGAIGVTVGGFLKYGATTFANFAAGATGSTSLNWTNNTAVPQALNFSPSIIIGLEGGKNLIMELTVTVGGKALFSEFNTNAKVLAISYAQLVEAAKKPGTAQTVIHSPFRISAVSAPRVRAATDSASATNELFVLADFSMARIDDSLKTPDLTTGFFGCTNKSTTSAQNTVTTVLTLGMSGTDKNDCPTNVLQPGSQACVLTIEGINWTISPTTVPPTSSSTAK
jgi:hypothetical protein